MTEKPAATPAAFYDALAPDYDEMTDFDQRFVREKPYFRLIVERYSITSALDAGSGTGFLSLLLARLGVQTTAVDVSAAMLRRLETHAAESGTPVEIVRSSFQRLPARLAGKYSAVFCLGNSLAHLLTDNDLQVSLTNFRRTLVPGGILVAQVLNYDRILADRTRIQSVRQKNNKTFVRYYEYHQDSILFNILTIEGMNGHTTHRLTSVPLRPLTRDRLSQELSNAGFQSVEWYGGITLEPFDADRSNDCVVIAHNNV